MKELEMILEKSKKLNEEAEALNKTLSEIVQKTDIYREKISTVEDMQAELEEKVQSGTASALEKKILAYWNNAEKIIDLK